MHHPRQLEMCSSDCAGSRKCALAAALEVGARPELDGKMVVVILPDTGERYVTTPLFDELVGRR